jgi:hypothetical protein
MLRSFVVALALLLFAGTPIVTRAASHSTIGVTAPAPVGDLQLFATEAAAQKHCPKDTVVWLNTNSGIYHEKGMRWYGNTKHGAYVCRAESDAAGDRDTRNGQ